MPEIKLFCIAATERDTGTEIIHTPEAWRVEEIDADGDGGVALAIFTGSFAEKRAHEYAEQLCLRQRRD